MDTSTLPDTQIIDLLQIARTTLEQALRTSTKPIVSSHEPDSLCPLVNVTLYYCGQLQASMSGRGVTLAEAVIQATQRTATDERFRARLTCADLCNVRIDIWIYVDAAVCSQPDEALTTLDLGLEGLEIQRGAHAAYYKPSVALTSVVMDQEHLLRKLAKKAGLPPETWRAEGTVIRRTQWVHFVEDAQQAQGFLSLRRLRPVEQPCVTRENVEQALMWTQDHLLATQEFAGFYLYKYNPFNQQATPGPTSLIRQAGCAYALAQSAAREQDAVRAQTLTLSSMRAITSLLNFATPLPSGGMYVREPNQEQTLRGKLGTSALTLLALQTSTLLQTYEQQRQELVTALLALQEANGAFRCYTDTVSTEQDGTKQDFFPGEALLALCREAWLGSEKSLDAVERAFPYYRNYFRQRPTTAFILWQTDAWRLLYAHCETFQRSRARNHMDYAAFVFEMTDWLLQFQLDSSASHTDFIGGFAYPGRRPSSSTATYSEAIIRAYGLARSLRDSARMQRYRQAVLAGLAFLFRLQITPKTALLFREPARAVGGITQDLADFTIRCDYDQHAITAFLAVLATPGLLDADEATSVA